MDGLPKLTAPYRKGDSQTARRLCSQAWSRRDAPPPDVATSNIRAEVARILLCLADDREMETLTKFGMTAYADHFSIATMIDGEPRSLIGIRLGFSILLPSSLAKGGTVRIRLAERFAIGLDHIETPLASEEVGILEDHRRGQVLARKGYEREDAVVTAVNRTPHIRLRWHDLLSRMPETRDHVLATLHEEAQRESIAA